MHCDPLVEVISQLYVGDAGELVRLDIISDEVLEVQLRIHQTFQLCDELETFLVGNLREGIIRVSSIIMVWKKT